MKAENEELLEDLYGKHLCIPIQVRNHLKEIGITTVSRLKKRCIDKNGRYIILKIPNMQVVHQQNGNLGIADFFVKRGGLVQLEKTLLYPLSSFTHIVKTRSVNALALSNIYLVRQVYEKCIQDGEFDPMKHYKKVGVSANYQVAKLLNKLGLLSNEAFLKVQRPSWKFRQLQNDEIGPDGLKLVHEMQWSENAKLTIIHAVSLKFKDVGPTNTREWNSITLGELVKTFVRMSAHDILYFYTKGHIGSLWYAHNWYTDKFEEGFVEIEKKIVEFGFLSGNHPRY